MGKSVDLTGRKYGKLTVLRKTSERDSAGCVMWECLCECGMKKSFSTNVLNGGKVKTCGCGQNKLEDLTGRRFGRLTVVKLDKYSPISHSTRWICRCDCGNEKSVLASCLKTGKVTSCGCYSSEQKSKRSKTHGYGHKDRLYRIWSGMKSRCYSAADRNYRRYGARGIEICPEWRNDFMAFRTWAIANGYQDGLSIYRIDNDGMYSPENCRWVDHKAQSNNRRTNVYITYKGETHTAAEWAERTGIKEGTLVMRKRNGWSDSECLEIPPMPQNNQTTRKRK